MFLRQSFFVLCGVFLITEVAVANLCKEIRETSRPTDTDSALEADIHESLFPDADYPDVDYIGERGWNRKLLVCNRKRDTKGDEIKKIMTNSDYRSQRDKLYESNLETRLINGKYNFFGNVFTQQKYSYVLSKSNGVWTMVIPYDASINDSVRNRVDVYMGGLSTSSSTYDSTDMEKHAWHLYEISQLELTGAGTNKVWTLKPDAKPIAETHCATTTYFEGKENKYKGQHGANSGKRDRENKHISLGRIEYSYGGSSWKTGCRVDRFMQVGWRPDLTSTQVLTPSSADTWVLNNFIQTSEKYWSQPSNFNLRLLLKGFNESEFSSRVKNLLSSDDYLKVRFGTKFMPYGGNQIYKTSLIQFNNFSTMTTDGTYWHEVGHAFGLDDEYGGGDSSSGYKDNGCNHDDYSDFDPYSYQMCNGGAGEVRSIYHYIATSRYVLTSICSEDAECGSGEYCNKRLGLNRCLADGTSKIGEYCNKNKECGSNKCQGSGDARMCVCGDDGDCGSGLFCNKRLQMNRCLADGTSSIGQACDKNKECSTGKCQGNGNDRMCVCANDSDCSNGLCIKGPVGVGKNYCRATVEPKCPAGSGWSYEIRNPLNKDRCNRTVTETKALKCKLGALDKAKNWTGPHAQPGADECRSKKGKSPKGVKCSGNYRHTIRSGADTCTKEVTEHETPTCSSGWDYKSQVGRDVCQDK